MRYSEYCSTASEITRLEHLLSIMPEEREVERIGLESRLKKARKRLEGVTPPRKPIEFTIKLHGLAQRDRSGLPPGSVMRAIRAGILATNGEEDLRIVQIGDDDVAFEMKGEETRDRIAAVMDALEDPGKAPTGAALEIREILEAEAAGYGLWLEGRKTHRAPGETIPGRQ